MWTRIKRIGAALLPAVGAIALAVSTAVGGDNSIDLNEALAIGTLVGSSLLTYLVPQVPEAPWTKTAISVVMSLLALGAVFWEGTANGFDAQEVMMLVTTILTTLGAIPAPATSDNGTRAGAGAPTLAEVREAGVRL